MVELTETQRKGVQFLLEFYDIDIHKATGRSFMQAIVLIELAILHPGRYIHVIDHAMPLLGDREHIKNHMMAMICDILNKYYPKPIKEQFVLSQYKLRFGNG